MVFAFRRYYFSV